MSPAHPATGRPWVARQRTPDPSSPWDVWGLAPGGVNIEVPIAFFLSEEDAKAVAAAHETREGLKRAYEILVALVGDPVDPRAEPSLTWIRSSLEKAGAL